jgi:hypothetical protein
MLEYKLEDVTFGSAKNNCTIVNMANMFKKYAFSNILEKSNLYI